MKTLKRLGLFLWLKIKEVGLVVVILSIVMALGIFVARGTEAFAGGQRTWGAIMGVLGMGLLGLCVIVMLCAMIYLICRENWQEVKRRIP